MADRHAGNHGHIGQGDVAGKVRRDVFLHALQRNGPQGAHAQWALQRRQVLGGIGVPAQQMMDQQMLSLRDEERVDSLLAFHEQLKLADEHLEVTLEPRILDGKQLVDARRGAPFQIRFGKAVQRILRQVDMKDLACTVAGKQCRSGAGGR